MIAWVCAAGGAGDLSRSLNAFTRPAANRWPVVPALATVVLAARAHGLATIDSSFQDDKSSAESLSAACKSSRELVRLGLSASRPLPARFASDPPKTFPPPASSELFSSLLLVARGSMGRSLTTRH